MLQNKLFRIHTVDRRPPKEEKSENYGLAKSEYIRKKPLRKFVKTSLTASKRLKRSLYFYEEEFGIHFECSDG